MPRIEIPGESAPVTGADLGAKVEEGCVPGQPRLTICGGHNLRAVLTAFTAVSGVLSTAMVPMAANGDNFNFVGRYDAVTANELVGIRATLAVLAAVTAVLSLRALSGLRSFRVERVWPLVLFVAISTFAKTCITFAIVHNATVICGDKTYARFCPGGQTPAVGADGAAGPTINQNGVFCNPTPTEWKRRCAKAVKWGNLGVGLLTALVGWWFCHALWSFIKLVDLGVLSSEDPQGVWWGLSSFQGAQARGGMVTRVKVTEQHAGAAVARRGASHARVQAEEARRVQRKDELRAEREAAAAATAVEEEEEDEQEAASANAE